MQAAWHQNTGYLPITRAAFDLTRAQGFYERNPGTAISIEQITLKPPTENSRGLRLGSFVLIRDVIDDELEQAFAGKKSAQAALDCRGGARQPAAAPVRTRQSGPVSCADRAIATGWRALWDIMHALPGVKDFAAFKAWRADAAQCLPAALDIARSHRLPHGEAQFCSQPAPISS